ncbi:MAG: protein translocase subunit SecD [Mycobacterium sp.]|nr:protein translocase subunit SecD [Mycobacterium sp.]
MASSSAPVRPYRWLALFLVALIGVYLLVFLTGNKQAEPKLGIDLQGGTRVTLTARTPDGSKPTRESLDQALQIITARVNGLGVSGSEVVIDGDNLIITVPGNDGNQARNLGQTARLYVRPVIGQPIPVEAINKKPGPGEAPPGGPPGPGTPGAPPTSAPTAAPAPPAPPGPGQPAPPPGPPDPRKDLAARIKFEKDLRQSTNQTLLLFAVQYVAGNCGGEDFLAGNDDPNLPLVTCSEDGKSVYILDKSIIAGDQIKDATSGFDQQKAAWLVYLEFKDEAATTWADFTGANVGTQTAFTLDSKVVSAPVIREAIPGGRTEISGGDPPFTAESAGQLANVLKYGSLPLSFESSEAETVSATLGLTSLRAGLIAGAIGLAMVLVYSLLYYRALGLLTMLSLVASGAMIFGILVLLGRYINYTLDLAGIAGLIIGIGTTADSFVVFFERIKDEIREGRSFRSAVPRGWARARKTILSGNAVSFIAATVLYLLAVGQVKGFAFTLGLTSVLDTVVVFTVTWPLLYLASKSPLLAKPAFNGLGAVQEIARERRAARQVPAAAGQSGAR